MFTSVALCFYSELSFFSFHGKAETREGTAAPREVSEFLKTDEVLKVIALQHIPVQNMLSQLGMRAVGRRCGFLGKTVGDCRLLCGISARRNGRVLVKESYIGAENQASTGRAVGFLMSRRSIYSPSEPGLPQSEEELSRELSDLGVAERAAKLTRLAEAHYTKESNVGIQVVDRLRDQLAKDVSKNFSWSSLEAVVRNVDHGRSHPLSRHGGVSAAAVTQLAEKAVQALDSRAEPATVRDACRILLMMRYIRYSSSQLLLGINKAEVLIVDAVQQTEEVFPLFGLLNAFGDSSRNKSGVECSKYVATAVYDQLAKLLTLTKNIPENWFFRDVLAAVTAIARLRIRHPAFLSAWEEYLLNIYMLKGFPRDADVKNCLYCFAYLGHPCPTLQKQVLADIEAGGLPLEAPSYQSTFEIDLLHNLLLLNAELPENIMWRLMSKLNPQWILQLSVNHLNVLEQVISFLPLNVDQLAHVVKFVQSAHYYKSIIVEHIARVRKSYDSWNHVLVDKVCPGGRVPVIALLSSIEDRIVLEWPQHIQPMQLHPGKLGDLPGVPVALLFPRESNLLRDPRNALAGTTALQKRLLEKQGFHVFVVKPDYSRISKCSNLGDLINLAESP